LENTKRLCPQPFTSSALHCDTVNRVPRQRLHDAPKCGSCHLPLFERRPVELTDAIRFGKHANKSDLPLLVDFWAAWCGPCRAMAPIFEKAAAEFEPDVRFVKVDSDAVPELLRRFHDQSLPTLLRVLLGREIARKSGLLSLPALLAWVSAKCRQC
jgi:thioredoxin 2